MSQHDMSLADQSGASFRADLNNALGALVTNNSGATEPTNTFAYMWWADTTTGILKQRNSANNAWISVLTISTGKVLLSALSDAATTATTATNLVGGTVAFSAYRATSNQSVSTGTPTKVALNAEEFDTNTNFDSVTNYRFTPTVAGYYSVLWSVAGQADAGTLTLVSSNIFKNGSSVAIGTFFIHSGATQIISNGGKIIYFNGSTDYIELYCTISGTSPFVNFGSYLTYLSGCRISP